MQKPGFFEKLIYEGDIFTLDSVTLTELPLPQAVQASAAKLQEESPPSVEELRSKATDAIRGLFDELGERVLALDELIMEKPNTLYVAYRVSNNFAEVHIGKNQIKILLCPIDYVDPKGQVGKIPDGYNWTLDRRMYLKSPDELDDICALIEQSYKNVL